MHKTFEEYQQFTRTTAVYPEAHTQPYLALGMCDEVGELLEKIEWLDTSRPPNKSTILAEAGDVLWYIARFSDHAGLCLGHLYDKKCYDGPATLQGAAVELAVNVAAIAGRTKKELRDGAGWNDDQRTRNEQRVADALKHAMGALEAVVRGLGDTLPQVAFQNQQKLTDRRERGVIKGDGDNR
jgi:NTP pyrophosphatase (non-canonical NTP hydrolase)